MISGLHELVQLGQGGGVLRDDGQRFVTLRLHHVRRQGRVTKLLLRIHKTFNLSKRQISQSINHRKIQCTKKGRHTGYITVY
jgi:hypothetical protein